MRGLKLIALLGLILAVSGTAGAVTVPSYPTGSAVYLENYDRDMGTAYFGPSDWYTRTVRGGTWSSANSSAFTTVIPATGAWAGAGEDTWGIFDVATIAPGQKTGNNIIQVGTPTYIWDSGSNMTGNTALVGVFYDGWDSQVIINNSAPPGSPILTVFAEEIKFELWAVDKSKVDLFYNRQGPAYDANLRTAQNEYLSWVDQSDTTAVKLLTGTSTEFRFTGSANSSDGTFDGQTLTYWDINENDSTGLWNANWGASSKIDPFIDDFGNKADMKLTFDSHSGTQGWAINSTDSGGVGFVVPEPLTMLGVFLGIGGLGGYIRRRRMA